MANPNYHKKQQIKQKNIQYFLSDLQDFQFGQKQKFSLQQHMTPAPIAGDLLYYIYHNQNIKNSYVADLGIGTGMLTCGLLYIGVEHVLGVEFDQKYIQTTRIMLEDKVQGASFQLINADVRTLNIKHKSIDFVVMNPPFGTKQAGIDMIFMQLAMKISKGNIYSMHKSSTRKFITKFCLERGYDMTVFRTVKFPLKKRFNKFHKKEVAFTQVDIIIVSPIKVIQQDKKVSKQDKIVLQQDKRVELKQQ